MAMDGMVFQASNTEINGIVTQIPAVEPVCVQALCEPD
jgi:hypothetical protein